MRSITTVLGSFVLFTCLGVPAQAGGLIPVHFEANRGQTAAEVKFLSRGTKSTLFLTPSEAVLSIPTKKGRDVLRIRPLGIKTSPVMEGTEVSSARVEYFIGKDSSSWKTDVPAFRGVRYGEIYRGIDWFFHADAKNALEYDFQVAPGADPRTIALDFSGAKSVSVDKEGTLKIALGHGVVSQAKPTIYQKTKDGRREIRGGYVMKGGRRVGFQVASYDRALPLVIDPVLSYATYVGGDGDDAALSVFRDAGGRLYVTGRNHSTDFPVESGFQAAPGGVSDALVAVLDPSKAPADQLVYSTYLGGIGEDQGWGIAADAAGLIYVTGETSSGNFPTKNGFQDMPPALSNAFVTVLDPSKAGAAQLVYSTCPK